MTKEEKRYKTGDKVVLYLNSFIPAIAVIQEQTKSGYWVKIWPDDKYHIKESNIQGYFKEYTALDSEGKRL